MNIDRTRIDPPLYLASTTIDCWRCAADMPAVAIVAPKVAGAHGDVCVLADIRSLPGKVRGFIQKRFPSFRLRYSKTTRSEYYANVCPRCNVLSGDFYLHSEPGGPFFPPTEAEAARLKVEEIPIAGPIEVEASFGVGCGELILEHGKRVGEGCSM